MFDYCTELEKIVIPDSVTEISWEALAKLYKDGVGVEKKIHSRLKNT